MREIVNAIGYVLQTGCARRFLPNDFPPMTIVYSWFLLLRRERVFETANLHLITIDREQFGREGFPAEMEIAPRENLW